MVFDDDGGRAQIIPRQDRARQEATYHGGPVVPRGTVQAVFLGSGWRNRENQGKESEVMRALRGQAGRGRRARSRGTASRRGNPPALRLEDTAGDPLSGTRHLRPRDPGPPGRHGDGGSRSTPTPSTSSSWRRASARSSDRGPPRDFAAYHNHYHSAAGLVRYVVVPYDADLARWAAAARRSLRQALINPEGNGWY